MKLTLGALASALSLGTTSAFVVSPSSGNRIRDFRGGLPTGTWIRPMRVQARCVRLQKIEALNGMTRGCTALTVL